MDYETINSAGDKIHLDMVALHFSTRCGASCSFCYASDVLAIKEEPTSLPLIKKVLNKIAADGVTEVLFVGGDPVTHPDFIESLKIAKELGLLITVLSNSWAIRPVERFDEALKYIDYCEATVLGSNPKTHDSITNRKNSYKNLIVNLKKVAANGKEIGVCINAMPQNLTEVYDLIEALVTKEKITVRNLMIQRIIPSGAATGKFKFGLNLGDVESLMQQIDKVAQTFGISISFEDPVPWCTVNEKYHKYLARCEWGYTKGSVNATGGLNRCGADDHYRLGSIFDGNLQEKWATHPILNSFRSKNYLPDECNSCSLLGKCGGGCPLSCGTLKDHDLDHLYIQRKEKEKGKKEHKNESTILTEAISTVRFGTEQDLVDIVKLESRLFGGSGITFSFDNILLFFEQCPKAFRVVCKDEIVQGYSVIAPLNEFGLEQMKLRNARSIIDLDPSGLDKQFSANNKAIFVEVIGVDKKFDAPSFGLLKNLVEAIKRAKVPVYTFPITTDGNELANRLGFELYREYGLRVL